MLCPWCEHHNLPGDDRCRNCELDLTQHDRPIARDRVEASLMGEPVASLQLVFPVTLPATATVREAVDTMLDNEIGAVLVVDAADILVGIFSERDLLMKVVGLHLDFADRPVSEFMTRRPVALRESDSLAFALHQMDCGDYRHLPVLQDGELCGVVSVRDMLRHITRICKDA